jgi:uncharacterized protein
MKLIDANILLYAVNVDTPQHERIRRWWETALTDDEPIGFAWITLLGFLRISTQPHVFDRPLTPSQAVDRVNTWLTQPNTRIVVETEEHWRLLRERIAETGTAGNVTTDTHLACLAIEYGATIVSCDADFGRFPQVRWENPLAL